LKEHRSKVGEAEAKEIEDALAETRKAMTDNDPDKINSAVDRLTTASHKLAEAMYKSTAQQPGGPPPPAGDGPSSGNGGGDKGKDNVVDAEFVDVDDKNKK
jgi:molecular chaperone DnaK